MVSCQGKITICGGMKNMPPQDIGRSPRTWPEPSGGVTRYGASATLKLHFKQFSVPVGNVDGVKEGHPFLVARHAESFLHEGRPLRLERFPHERHIGLVGSSAALAPVAFVAGTDDVSPNGCAALGARNNVVEIEFLPRQAPAAVLA